MAEKQTLVVVPAQTQSRYTRLTEKLGKVSLVAGTAVLASPAFAEGLDYTAFTGEITSAQTGIAGVIGAIMVVLAMILGWNLFKRGAK